MFDRAASEFEALRLETEASGKRPKAFMLTIGNLAMRQARAQYSCNFLACAGYEVVDNLGFETVEAGVEAAMAAKADIVVICSSDDEYAEYAIPPQLGAGHFYKTQRRINGDCDLQNIRCFWQRE